MQQPRRTQRRVRGAAVTALLVFGLAACTSDDGDGAAQETPQATRTIGTSRPAGPAAAFAGPLEGGTGVALTATAHDPDLDGAGYVEEEYGASGTATAYTADQLPGNGRFTLHEGEQADYSTRVVVRRPAEAADFNGTVVVEWLNVTTGRDAAPDFGYLAPELLRGGYAWVGVSAQFVGVEGAAGADGTPTGGVRQLDPDRYGDLHHPGDAFSYDIVTQVARALRSPGDTDPLGGLEAQRVLATGDSQSAFALTTYVDGVQPLTQAFDGFLLHSRGVSAASLGQPGAPLDLASAVTGPPTLVRDDGDVPVIMVQTESDVLGVIRYLPARQPDNDTVRLWEIAGAAHVDAYLVGPDGGPYACPVPINRGQQTFVLRAALRALDDWAADGTAPPEAPRLDVDERAGTPAFVLDDVGNVRGGIRTPVVEAPVDVLSGLPPAGGGGGTLCLLAGTTTPIDTERLAGLYPSREDYLDRYTDAADAVIEAGFALADDRAELLAGAEPERLPA